MRKIDILTELVNGSMTYDEGMETYTKILNSPDAEDVAELLGMTSWEWTAYLHAVPFDVLAKWRSEGWPTNCHICGLEINVESFGWWASWQKGQYRLVHIYPCLASSQKASEVK